MEIATLMAPLGLERFIPLMGAQTLAAQPPPRPHCIQASFKGPIGQTEIQQGFICQFFLTLCRSGDVKLI